MSSDVLSMYIKKLGHPMKEIRERSLQLLTAKLKIGLQINDELSCTRKLLESLLSWFDDDKPTLQNEALCLLLKTIKTKSGTYIIKELDIKKVLSNLMAVKHKIDPNAKGVFDDVIESLRFLNTVESDSDLIVPPLSLASSTSSENKISFNNGYDNSTEYDVPLEHEGLNLKFYLGADNSNRLSNWDGIRVLLFPWVDLYSSDLKTLTLLEDALKVVKSIRRCCRFIRDVLLRDFRPEIFLNRPTIVNILLNIATTQQNGHLGEALHVLLCITRALHQQLEKLFSVELDHVKNKVSKEITDPHDDVNTALENIIGECTKSPESEDSLAVLRQMPVPVYALDTSYSILSIMSRSLFLLDPNEYEALSIQELNICLNLIDSLIDLLLNCITDKFWTVEHTCKTHKDIAHKTCMLMRILGELITKYKRSFTENTEGFYHRTAWLRLITSAEKLLNWLKNSPLPPVSLISALQSAQLDPAIELLYPELSKRINDALLASKALTDKEHRSKYNALKKLFVSMNYAVQCMKNKNDKSNKEILTQIQNSLQILSMQQNESFLEDITNFLLYKSKHLFTDEDGWTTVRSVSIKLMSHKMNWVKVKFYQMLEEMVKSVLFGNDMYENEHDQCLMLLCDVGVLTEICCHGLSSHLNEVNVSASTVMVYLLRGRLVLSESCWWRLLASLLPILPLLHVYASHDTELGKAICRSLEPDIVQCMGVSFTEMVGGLTRLLFVKCIAVQLEAAHALCRLLDDDRYLPPKESLRSDLLLNALRRTEPQDFNLDTSSSLTSPQTAGLVQVLEVLKQDLTLDAEGKGYIACNARPTLEPSLRRSTLQQLSVLLRQPDAHDAFIQQDGINLIVSILRLSLMVDDYLAFPECAISCVSVLNSVSFASRHNLAKVVDLPLLLIRVILVFPSNDPSVLMSAQILALTAWSGFVLQEINSSRQKVPALPLCVTQRTSLPFQVNSYWSTSPNSEHCSLEWLLSDDEWRRAIRIRWWCAWAGGERGIRNALVTLPTLPAASLSPDDLALVRSACVIYSSTKGLLALENATSHSQVIEALALLQSYTSLVSWSCTHVKEYAGLPWQHVRRFLCAPPASSSDTALLITLLQFIIGYMDNVPTDQSTMSWIKAYFIGNDVTVISLLSRDRLYPQQMLHEGVEVTQLHIHIIKIIWRCIKLVENHDDYDARRMESLLKILISCLDKIDVKNFHMLGYLNELMRCIRYALYSRYCKLSEESLLGGLKVVIRVLCGCGGASGQKGQSCKLDAFLALNAFLRHLHAENIPVQRWSEIWSEQVLQAVTACASSDRVELRAAALHVIATLAHYAQLLPHLMQSIPNAESLCSYALDIFLRYGEANVVRTSAASLLAANAVRTSTHTDVFENDVIKHLQKNDFLESCLQIFIDFCCDKKKRNHLHPNTPLSVLERRSELEVRAQKSGDVHLSPTAEIVQAPPTADLLIAVADLFHNVTTFKNSPIEAWNELGIYRVIFRCASWDCSTVSESIRVRSALCRSLSAVASHKCVRVTLANTKDCLVKLLRTLTASSEDDREELRARTHTFYLVAVLLAERSAADSVWNELCEGSALSLFTLLQRSIVHVDDELQDAAIYFLTQLAKSALNKKHADKTADESFADFFNNYKSGGRNQGEGDGRTDDDCQPEYACEEFCKLIIYRFQDLFDKRKYKASQDEGWISVCSCLSYLLTASSRCRLYAVHRRLPSVVLAALQAVRDQLSLHGKPADVIRNANHEPVLLTLYWLLTIMNCSMLECPPAKESFADNAAASLNKLWPWCMMTEQLRCAIMHLLVTFTNDCPKAWACMCACVGGRNLINELCTLVGRNGGPLLLALRILRQCAPHHHCRAILLKSEVLSCMGKTCGRGRSCGAQSAAWAHLCAALARHADGGAALLSIPTLRPPHVRLLPALTHAAHHHRAAFLHAPDLLELFSAALLAGNTAEVALAARAVWALAANNHRAKQVLRSAGVTAAVQSALQRHQRANCEETQQALQLLTYTNNVLQAT